MRCQGYEFEQRVVEEMRLRSAVKVWLYVGDCAKELYSKWLAGSAKGCAWWRLLVGIGPRLYMSFGDQRGVQQ